MAAITPTIFIKALPPSLRFQRLATDTTNTNKKGTVHKAMASPISVLGLVSTMDMQINAIVMGKCWNLRVHGLLFITGRL